MRPLLADMEEQSIAPSIATYDFATGHQGAVWLHALPRGDQPWGALALALKQPNTGRGFVRYRGELWTITASTQGGVRAQKE